MGWLELSLLSLAAIVLAANQLLRDAPNISLRFPSLKPRGWWNYVPFGFLVLAGAVYLVRLALPDVPIPTIATRAPTVIQGIPVQTLVGFHEGRTQLEAERLIAPFVGASVQVRGTVASVEGNSGGSVVWLAERPVANVGVAIYLAESQRWYAERLRIGDQIQGRCELRWVLPLSVSLHRCAIPGAPPPPPSDLVGNAAP